MMFAKTSVDGRSPMGHYSHLGIEEREDIMLLRRERGGVGEIAEAIGSMGVFVELAWRTCGVPAPPPTKPLSHPEASSGHRPSGASGDRIPTA